MASQPVNPPLRRPRPERAPEQPPAPENPPENPPPAAAAVPIYEIAPCENAVFYRKYLISAPIFTGLMFRNLNIRPFNGNWDNKNIATMVYLGNYGRCRYQQIPHEPIQNTVAVMAEMLGPYLAEGLFLRQAQARDMVIKSVQELVKEENLRRVLPNFNQVGWNAIIDDQQSYVHAQAYTNVFGFAGQNDFEVASIEAAIRILYHLAAHTNQMWTLNPLDLIVGVTVSIAKRGTLSVEFMNKIVEGILQDLGANINLEIEAIQTFYRFFAGGIDDVTIPLIQRRWQQLIPQQALRLTLTVAQLAGSGLTTYSTIGTALRKYPNFNWGVIERTFPTEWANFRVALNTVGNNVYYGFRRDLGVVKSTNFKSLGYIAKELLVRADGRVTLNRYMGWARSIKFKAQIDQMILDFANRLAAAQIDVNNVEPPETNLVEAVNTIIDGLDDGEAHMFM